MIKKTKDILMGKNDIQPAIPCTTVDVLGSCAQVVGELFDPENFSHYWKSWYSFSRDKIFEA